MGWNFGDILDTIEPVIPPDQPAFIHGDRVIRWGEASRATNNLARAYIARGARAGDKIALYMRNRPEYMLALAGAFKARLTHVNVNYRYTPQEVWYIFDNSDAQTVVYASEFRQAVNEIRSRLPKVHTWVEVSDDGEILPFAEPFHALAGDGDGLALQIKRADDDQFFLYTGGTTGMPKGVVWAHRDLGELTVEAIRAANSLDDMRQRARSQGNRNVILPLPPLMHGTGVLTAMGAHLAGGCVVTLEGVSFDPEEALAAIDRHRPQTLVIVGDSFARPILNVLNAMPGRFDVSSIATIRSSGVMWSLEVKRGLLEHMPNAQLIDAFSSSEAMGMGASVMTAKGEVQTAKFQLGERCRVFDENDDPVEPGSGVSGLVAIGPPNPLGYYKDEAKTSRTFRTINGVRYSIPGDWCRVEAGGALTLLGRGSACINTAGEKVFPEEVEEALKTHPSVEDALVIGIPDEKWGQAVTAVVRLVDGHSLDTSVLRAHVRASLAGYKVPKQVLESDRDLRASNGKADYAAAKAVAESASAHSTA